MDVAHIFEVWSNLLDRFYRLNSSERTQLQSFYNELRNLLARSDDKYNGSLDFPTVQDLAKLHSSVTKPDLFKVYVRIASNYPSWLSQQFNIDFSQSGTLPLVKTANGRRGLRRVPFKSTVAASKKSKKSLRRTLKKFYCK